MWYLSKIELERGLAPKELARTIPANAYAEHQAIWQLMSTEREQPRDFLFRREQAGHWPMFYVLSAREPAQSSGAWRIQTRTFQPRLAAGQRLAFALRANPVRTRKVSDDPQDKRRYRDDVVMHAKRLEQEREPNPARRLGQAALVQQAGPRWLEDRAEANGFALEAIHVDDYQQHRLTKRGNQNPIRFSTLDYQGVLRVTDAERFLITVHRGIGHAKGFGCGLLLIRRPN